ncbi:MAG: pentapeptide repeat-containing protein [Lachnospiraceae bacterium]|nr:pentapeptide repeat-containing protein [Lachnospiraceae bacterium]
MNRKEAILKYQEEVSEYLNRSMEALEENFLKEEKKLKNNICAIVIQLFSSVGDKERIQYIQMSLLRSRMDEDVFQILVSLHDETYFLDKNPLMQTLDVSSLFVPLKEARIILYQRLEYYQGKIEKFDADRMIRETAMTFYKKMADRCRMLFRDMDRLNTGDKISETKRLVVKWGGFQEVCETVFMTETNSKTQQQFLAYNEKNRLDQWDTRYVYQSWEYMQFTDVTEQKRNLLFIMFRNCQMERCQWENCLMHGASFRGAKLKQVIFAGCDLSGSDFRETEFDQVRFVQCNLSAADFTGNRIDTVQFTGSRMDDARFSRDSLSCGGLDVSQLQQIQMEEESYVF